MISISFALLLAIFYLAITIGSTYLWSQDKEGNMAHVEDIEKISVLVIGRNESQSISKCLHSISNSDYPKTHFEIIFVDDHSEDNTLEIAQNLGIDNLRVLQLDQFDLSRFQGRFKKAGQFYGVMNAKFNTILQTDADCTVEENWLMTMELCLRTSDICTSIVNITNTNSFLGKWQAFENIGTMTLTCAGLKSNLWYSANAANMGYKKELFTNFLSDVSNIQHASGDDIFLINWAQGQGYKTVFLKSHNTIVSTSAESTVNDLFQQRLRWATKTKSYRLNGLKLLMSSLFLFHLTIVVGLFMFLFTEHNFFLFTIILLLAKWFGDYVLLSTTSTFFNRRYAILLSPIFSTAHLIYVVIAGLAGLTLRDFTWKGRKTR